MFDVEGGTLVPQGVHTHSSVDVKLEKHKNVAQQAAEVKSGEKRKKDKYFFASPVSYFLFQFLENFWKSTKT